MVVGVHQKCLSSPVAEHNGSTLHSTMSQLPALRTPYVGSRHLALHRFTVVVVVVNIIIIIIIIISFMQGIYTHIPEKNYVPREYSVAAILLFVFMVLISLVSVLNLLHFYISTFRSMCAVPNMAVFCSSVT